MLFRPELARDRVSATSGKPLHNADVDGEPGRGRHARPTIQHSLDRFVRLDLSGVAGQPEAVRKWALPSTLWATRPVIGSLHRSIAYVRS